MTRLPAEGPATDHIWYAAYGSNMHTDRLRCYLAGGRPPGGLRAYPGCRDPREPLRAEPVMLPGLLYFATLSRVWGGGRAFYEPPGGGPGPGRDGGLPGIRRGGSADRGQLPARAYLLTTGQFSDIAAQEMYREPGGDLDLTEVLARGRARLGPGRYETLVCAGALDGRPVLTFTAPWRSRDIAPRPPSAPYLRHIAAGITAAHGWPVARTAAYLAGCPGAAGRWTPAAVAALAAEGDGGFAAP